MDLQVSTFVTGGAFKAQVLVSSESGVSIFTLELNGLVQYSYAEYVSSNFTLESSYNSVYDVRYESKY